MTNRTTLNVLRLGALAWSLSASMAHAGKIAIAPAAGEGIVAMLNGESTLFANAYRTMLAKEGIATTGNSTAWNRVRFATHSPTVARMEYTFVRNGRQFTRIYHARSGPAMEVVLSRIDFTAPGNGSRSGSSGTESEGSRPYKITEEDIAKDFAERKYYPIDTEFNVRAPNLPPQDSVLESLATNNGGDAELKIFRQIENDIATKTVSRGGRLVGYVSKAVCQSCSAASVALAESFGIEGHIYQLVEAATGVPLPRDPKLLASGESSAELKSLRKAYAASHFKRDTVTDPGETSWAGTEALEHIDRIEAEEARTALAAPCGD
ncbi:MAG TPA: hypothetical protein VM621_06690 [Luteibacter sp.]|uniref:hypothetical protein n=1 Tax=Luteibacter sp. TaxID=1886636 RepID=UPI002CC5E2E0|nr:hypothetical protein [Luteibacter sp.]HVI54723.1 hypothetical protein [Luteibacter sp.]